MARRLTREILEAHLHCRYKGHLYWAGERAEPADYEVLSAGHHADVRRQVIDRIVARQPAAAVVREASLAACLATERGVGVCCPVHDAFLIEADADAIEEEAGRMQDAMREASELVLPGFPLKADTKIVRYPDRYSDPRGERMWDAVGRILADLAAAGVCHR
jgi:hypothetical protein